MYTSKLNNISTKSSAAIKIVQITLNISGATVIEYTDTAIINDLVTREVVLYIRLARREVELSSIFRLLFRNTDALDSLTIFLKSFIESL